MSDLKPALTGQKKNLARVMVNTLLAVVLTAAVIWAVSTFFNLDRSAWTNDAQVEEYINPVNIRIPGYVRKVYFQEHQLIRKGDTLLTLDDREYRIALEQAEAVLASATAAKNVTFSSRNTVESNLGITDANMAAAKARLWNARQNFLRYRNLLADSAATQQQFDQVKTEYDALQAQATALAKQRHTTALSTNEAGTRIAINDAEIRRAQAAVDLARLNLSYTVVTAPYEGYSGRRNVEEGQLVQAGQNLLSFVRNDEKWIIANYRETQLPRIHVGDKVRLVVDGLDGKEMNGRVFAIAEATGSRFSAIPTDNSSGNFVKVQQRVPVKIILPEKENNKADLALLKAGMNVEAKLINN